MRISRLERFLRRLPDVDASTLTMKRRMDLVSWIGATPVQLHWG